MKKTILATLIAATSFGSVAGVTTPIDESPVMGIPSNGDHAPIMRNPDNSPVMGIPERGDMNDRVGLPENPNQPITIPRENDGWVGINPPSDEKPMPIVDTNKARSTLANKALENKTIDSQHGVTVADITVSESGQVTAIVAYEDEKGNEIIREVSYQSTGEYKENIRNAVSKERNAVNLPTPVEGINPPNDGVEKPMPIRDDIILTPEAKEALVEEIKSRNDFGTNPPPADGDLPPVETPDLPIVTPVPGEVGNGTVQSYAEQAQEVYAKTQAATDAQQDAAIASNTLSINDLYNQVDRLDEKMDGVMASTQAVTAARPYMGANQTNAIGVGLGHAGDAQSMAIGYGHRMNENWTANANVSITTASDTDVSVGAGVGYAW
ncbi:YadA C-terminal domain-containing protein [Vibrio lamellibrachiae]|uniref:YadA C-terminal domain-containing protein n=1 Tax=Vibrio lamellibrachiae TaxID=2910253 RepID=UPI003D0F83DC